jgi:tetratricopeptide (TPR) repeat protein
VRASRRERLPRDLDNIVLMAMRKEPQRRYASAQELGADVRRCLEHRPVQAQRDTLTYVVSSFVRRHVGAVAAAAAIVLLLVGGVIATTWQWRQAVEERTRAESQQRTAEETLAFLIDLFKVPPESRDKVSQVSARDVLEHGIARLGDGSQRSLRARGALQHALGVIYSNLGDYPKAAGLLKQAIASRSKGAGGLLELADSLYQLGTIEVENSEPMRALALLWSALTIRTELLGGDHPQVADVLEELSRHAIYKLPFAAAEAYLRRAVEIRRKDPRTDVLRLSTSMAHLAELYSFSGHHEEADAVAHEAVVVRKRAFDSTLCRDGDGEFFNELALWRSRQGYFDEAERQLDAAVNCYRRQLGPEHPDVADLSALRVVLWREQGRYVDAERLGRESLAVRTRLRAAGSLAVDNAQHHLSRVLYERGNLIEAEQLATLALNQRKQRSGHVDNTVASSLTILGEIHLAAGDSARAESELREALNIWQRTKNDHPEIPMAWRSLARALLAQNQVVIARSAAETSLDLYRRHLRPLHPEIATTLAMLGEIAQATSPAVAEPLLREVLRIRRLELTPAHPYIARAESALGDCLVREGRIAEAFPFLRHAVEVLRDTLGDPHPDTRRAVALLQAAMPVSKDDAHKKR